MTTGEGWCTTEDGDGIRLWHVVEGEGVPVVLCHGGPGLWDNLGSLAALLHDHSQIVRWDQRGCGRSDRVGPYATATSIADLESLRTHLGLDRWVVGGHSWGASLALHYALAHPDRCLGLVYISGTGTGRSWHPAYKAAMDDRLTPTQLARREELTSRKRSWPEEIESRTLAWAPDFFDRAEAIQLAAAEAAVPFEINWECNRTIGAEAKAWDEEELLERCSHLDVPTLIVHGVDDPRPPFAVDALHAALPRSELHVIDRCGHLPWIEAARETSRLARAFLDGIAN